MSFVAEASDSYDSDDLGDLYETEMDGHLASAEKSYEGVTSPPTSFKDGPSSSGIVKGKSKLVVRPHEKRNVPRSQTQALGSLAAGVNKMADTQSKRLKLQEESEKMSENGKRKSSRLSA